MDMRRITRMGLVLALAATPLLASTGHWALLGPEGGEIALAAADPAQPVVWAATQQALFRSGDAGATWSAVRGAPDAPSALAVRGGLVFVGTHGKGLWRADSNGAGWQQLTSGLPASAHVDALAVAPGSAARLWVATEEGLFASDDGTSFTSRGGDLGAQPFTAVAIDGGGRVYAHTLSDLYTSTDGGAQWSLLRCFGHSCGDAVADPQLADTVLAWNGVVILRSRDGGADWDLLHAPRNVGNPVPLGFQGARLFAVARRVDAGGEHDTLLLSDDLGDSWSPAVAQPEDPAIFSFTATADFAYLGSTGNSGIGGVFRSDDGGVDWQRASSGLVGRWINSVAVDASDAQLLYARAEDHVFASDDGGASWRLSLVFQNVRGFGTDELVADPRAAGRVWLASYEGLYRSDDRGQHWARAPRLTNMTAIALDPRTSAGVWAAGSSGLWHTTDGRHWQPVRIASRGEVLGVEDIAVDPQNASIVWVGGYATTRAGAGSGIRLYRSTDGGRTWKRRDSGIGGTFVGRVALDPTRSGTLFVSASGALFRSRDAGASWEPLALPAGLDGAYAIDAFAGGAPTSLYAYRTDPATAEVYRSEDDGDTWQTLGDLAADGGAPVESVTVDPSSPSTVLVGTAGHGVFGWTDP